MVDLKSAIPTSLYLNSLSATQEITLTFCNVYGRFQIDHNFIDMVFVHVSRCLIFKVHQLCSLFEIPAASSVSLNRGDSHILARFGAFVKNFFAISQIFSQFRLGHISVLSGALGYTTTAFAICQQFFAIIPYYFFLPSASAPGAAATGQRSRQGPPLPAARRQVPSGRTVCPEGTSAGYRCPAPGHRRAAW